MTRPTLVLLLGSLAGSLALAPRPGGCLSGTRLDVSPTALAIVESGTGGLAATATTGCRRVTIDTGTVTWASTDTAIATVAGSNRTATVTGVSAGSALIVATFGTVADTASVTVTAADTVACTASSTHFCPGDDLNTKVQAAATGASFTFGVGTYALQSITPKTGQTFTGGTGVILDGGRTLTGWTASGSNYYVGGQTQGNKIATAGGCDPSGDYPRCQYPEQLWRDGVLQRHVAGLAYLTAGAWYFDYTADRIYVRDDPTGHTLVTSVTDHAFQSTAANVTITGLTITHYAPGGTNSGAIDAEGTGWTITDNVLRDNGSANVRIEGNNATVSDNILSTAGQYGLSAAVSSGLLTGLVVERNRLDSNNTARWNRGFGAGGMKLVRTDSLVFSGNRAQWNFGNAFWWDIDNRWVLADHDTATANMGTGFFCEIGYGCKITFSVSTGNGTSPTDAFQNGAGMLCSATSDCEFANNTVSGNQYGIILLQQSRGSGAYGPHLVTNANIHDNAITMTVGTTGFKGDFDVSAFNFSRNNCFTTNAYTLPAGVTKFFASNGGTVADATWQAAGCNSGETITR